MTIFSSKSARAFYDSAIISVMPDDAVEIPAALRAAVLLGESEGKVIEWGSDGFPVLVEPPSLSADQVWEKIKAERERRTFAGFYVNGQWVHSDLFSRSQWLGLKDDARDVLAAGGAMTDTLIDDEGQAISWKMLGGTFVTVTAQLAFDVVAAVKCSDIAIFTVAEQHNAAMRAAEVPADYDFTAYWPQTYAEWAAAQQEPEVGEQ